MEMRTVRPILVLAVMFVVFAAAYVSAQQPDIKSLAGVWRGYAIPTRGSNVALEVNVKPDGTYTSKWGPPINNNGVGTIRMEGGKLMADGHLLYGTGTTDAGTGRAELTLTQKDGKQTISGAGRDNDGPYNFQLTKQ